MHQYSKGDIIELGHVAAIVLDNGLSGREFYYHVAGQFIREIFIDGTSYRRTFYHLEVPMENYVWYPVLMGDKKGWYCNHVEREKLNQRSITRHIIRFKGIKI